MRYGENKFVVTQRLHARDCELAVTHRSCNCVREHQRYNGKCDTPKEDEPDNHPRKSSSAFTEGERGPGCCNSQKYETPKSTTAEDRLGVKRSNRVGSVELPRRLRVDTQLPNHFWNV